MASANQPSGLQSAPSGASPFNSRAATDATIEVINVQLDNTAVELEVDQPITITSTVTVREISTGTERNVQEGEVLYEWEFNKGGVVSANLTTQPQITLQGSAAGEVEVRLNVYVMIPGTYTASPLHPWYHATIANCAVATTYAETPQVKQFGSQFFEDLPGWGEQTTVDDDGNVNIAKYKWKCERVRSFNNRLFALNVREMGVDNIEQHYPLRLRWSNFADEDHAPTLWDDYAYLRDPDYDNESGVGEFQALQNGYAGYIDLADSNGAIIDMLPLKDYLFVYTEFETYIGTPTMNTYSPFMFKKIFNDSGILAPDCVCEVDGGHFIVTQNDIILHNGSTKRSLVTSRVRKKIISEISSVNPIATKVFLRSDKNEVWVIYAGPGSEKGRWECNKAAVWNYEFDTWTFRTMPYIYGICLADPPVLDKSGTWPQFQTMTWNEVKNSRLDFIPPKKPWQRNDENFHKRIVIGPTTYGGFAQMDIGQYDIKVSYDKDPVSKEIVGYTVTYPPLEMKLVRSGIDFDNATEEWNQKHINKFRPQVSGQGTYQFEVGGTQYTNEQGHSHSTKDYVAGKDRHVAVRLNHPYLYYNIYDRDPTSTLGINSIVIEYKVGGRR